ncbi:MAG: hypothetical protein Q7W30_03025 [Coriobacteriia bacterium]|nr:hypothetical protein [Coriobacteriia bacterium]
MCENSVNIPQLKVQVGQADDLAALVQQQLEQLHHLADHGKQHDASVELAQANVLLGEVRGKLERALLVLDGGGTPSADVTVELV